MQNVLFKLASDSMRRVARRLVHLQRPRRALCTTGEAGGSPEVGKRELILEKALCHVHELGWSEKALAQASVDVGLPPLSHKVVERGPAEIVELFLRKKRDHVNSALSSAKSPAGIAVAEEEVEAEVVAGDSSTYDEGVKEKDMLYKAIEGHMEYIMPYASSWPSALALLLGPEQVLHTTQLVADLADDLVDYAGLQPTRSDWYTDRAILFSIYSSTQLYLLADKSEDYIDTKKFLESSVDRYYEMREKGMDPATLMSVGIVTAQSFLGKAMSWGK